VESSLEVQKLKPQVDLIKRRYGSDKDRIQRETNALYEKAGVKPLAGMASGSTPGKGLLSRSSVKSASCLVQHLQGGSCSHS
jgi:60Kd inner membrane protein